MDFLQFHADLNKKSKSVKLIYIYASKGLVTYFQKMVLFYHALTYCFGYIRVWSRITLLNFCWVNIQHHFWYLIADISWTASQTPIKHYFLKDCNKNFHILYVNCFNWHRFLALVSTKLQPMLFFGKFKDHNSKKKYGS